MAKYEAFLPFIMEEILHWGIKKLSYDEFVIKTNEITARRSYIVTFVIHNGTIDIIFGQNCHAAVKIRAELYRPMLEYIARDVLDHRTKLRIPIMLEDLAHGINDTPLFSFQKRKGDNVFLITDFDCLEDNFYVAENFCDKYSFKEKLSMSVFAGSTTGTHNKKVSILENERIRVAFALHNDEHVVFKLPKIVQYADEETLAYMQRLPFCGGQLLSYQEQYKYRFLISLDGNGATCERVSLALKSNSVLLKYQSDQIVWYHKLMQPYVHYIPIFCPEEISYISKNSHKIGTELFENISKNATLFYNSYLTRENVYNYTAVIINEFYGIFKKDNVYYNNKENIKRETCAF